MPIPGSQMSSAGVRVADRMTRRKKPKAKKSKKKTGPDFNRKARPPTPIPRTKKDWDQKAKVAGSIKAMKELLTLYEKNKDKSRVAIRKKKPKPKPKRPKNKSIKLPPKKGDRKLK